jgi:hypothetical protein
VKGIYEDAPRGFVEYRGRIISFFIWHKTPRETKGDPCPFKGITYKASQGKWVANISIKRNRDIRLGTFNTMEEALEGFQKGVKEKFQHIYDELGEELTEEQAYALPLSYYNKRV